MQVKGLFRKFTIAVIMLLLPFVIWAQNEVDSVLDHATKQIYVNPDTAIATAKRIVDKTDASADNKIKAILIISTAYSSKREYEKSMESALSAMDLFPELKNVNLKIKLLNRIGGIYQELQIYEKAILYLDKALESINKMPDGEDKSRNLGVNNLLRGFIYREQMNCEIALAFFEKGINEYKKLPETAGGNTNISTSLYNYGNCLLELGRIAEAKKSFTESIVYAERAGALSVIAFAQKGLAEVYTLQEEYSKAISLLTIALENSENVGDKVLNRALYDALATNYLATENFESYFIYRNKNIAVNKEIRKIERKTVDDSIMDLNRKNSEEIKTYQDRTQTLQIVFSTLIILLLFMMARHIFLSHKHLKSLKKRLKF